MIYGAAGFNLVEADTPEEAAQVFATRIYNRFGRKYVTKKWLKHLAKYGIDIEYVRRINVVAVWSGNSRRAYRADIPFSPYKKWKYKAVGSNPIMGCIGYNLMSVYFEDLN